MSELRQNIVTKEWVIIATERGKRPGEFNSEPRPLTETNPDRDEHCAFCPGNEHQGSEVLRMPPSGEWQVRVIRNKFPALSLLGSRERMFDGVHRRISGVGYHEVLIETPRHNSCPALETKEEVTAMMRAFSLRGKSIAQDERIEQIVYFKNHGQRAGTSMVHPHTQLIGLPVVSHDIRARVEEARRFFDDTGLCVYCKVLEDEIRDASRIVVEGKHFVAFIPYASFSPFHTWILPRRHEPSFLNITPEELEDLGNVLRTVIRKMYIGLHDPDYNYIIRSAPLRDLRQEYLHWYLTIVTRTSQSAGFELGSGMFINPTYPEDSAEFLRSVAAEG
jgi:UDPglucose--hexose-1-phosphate uridylyltransferase